MITWIPPFDAHTPLSSIEAPSPDYSFSVCKPESAATEVTTTHTGGISSSATVSVSPALPQGLSCEATATGFKIMGDTSNCLPIDVQIDYVGVKEDIEVKHTTAAEIPAEMKLVKFTPNPTYKETFTITSQVTWTWVIPPAAGSTTYDAVYTLTVFNKWKADKAIVDKVSHV